MIIMLSGPRFGTEINKTLGWWKVLFVYCRVDVYRSLSWGEFSDDNENLQCFVYGLYTVLLSMKFCNLNRQLLIQ